MNILKLFISESTTPNRRNHPALFIPRIREYNLPFSFHPLSHFPSFRSLMQWFRPSTKNPRLSNPNQTHDETPLFFSTMSSWGFPFLSSNTISNTLDSTTKLLSFLLLRLAALSSPSSPSHSLSLSPIVSFTK
ncbi:hypothetical protein PVL29_007591 [Vitis rotundifolia]|uniref:Uncharacterized protein n=1 Tax=Vitis rotundifolia TaxID=103349 RepID=A0AA39A091_VITRO|nr:hypothetical protein PVL29_007591 [Vitis rotundifolia]